MRIALVSEWDTSDPRAWSGVAHHMRETLSQHMELVITRVQAPHHAVDRALARLHGLLGRTYLPGHSVASARLLGTRLQRSLRGCDVDAVLAIGASPAVAMADVQVPVVHVTDATIHAITDYYPLYSGLGPFVRAQAEWLERRSQRKTAAVVTTSRWARDSFVHHYGMRPSQVSVVPFGPAIAPEDPPTPRRSPEGPPTLRALLVASHWERKGGDHAVAAVSRLRRAGVEASLTVVGHSPAGLPEWVHPLGSVPAEKLSGVYSAHDVLLELAEANAGGVTLTDAAAHGLPVVARNTGGVADIVKDDRSGYLIRSDQQADAALLSMTDPSTRHRLSDGARQQHVQVLNWQRWARHVSNTLANVIASGVQDTGRETELE